MLRYRLLQHTADIAIEVWGNSIDDLFKSSVEAWLDLSIEQKIFCANEKKQIKLSTTTLEELLKEFLSEINYMLHVKKWLTTSVDKISITEIENSFVLSATIVGEPIDFNKYQIQEEIKAVTFHQLKIEEKDNFFSTKIVFDI
ncbi:MAG: hypothetical protein A2V66_12000 [Ignavibacteria bacterium RBG_13_36_8]|nr:MAG: hypothetical protein A2V66_12000 [Ignavibacteria bacterium RBG_13_36_8]